jgi:hypothetical protein
MVCIGLACYAMMGKRKNCGILEDVGLWILAMTFPQIWFLLNIL